MGQKNLDFNPRRATLVALMEEMFHMRVEFGFGTEFDKDGSAILRDELQAALKIIKKEAAQIFGAYTLVPTHGGWTNSEGNLVTEDGCTLFTFQSLPSPEDAAQLEAKIAELAGVIKTQLNQEAVAVSRTLAQFELI